MSILLPKSQREKLGILLKEIEVREFSAKQNFCKEVLGIENYSKKRYKEITGNDQLFYPGEIQIVR